VVGSEEHGPRIHELLEGRHHGIGSTERENRIAVRCLAHGRNRQQIRLHRTLEVDAALETLRRRTLGEAIEQVERTEPRIDLGRRGYTWRHWRRILDIGRCGRTRQRLRIDGNCACHRKRYNNGRDPTILATNHDWRHLLPITREYNPNSSMR